MVSDFKDMVQRPYHNFAIVDEVDFVLIDEARTPLIISSPNNQPTDKYYKFAEIAAKLQPSDYVIDEKARSATLSEFGIRKIEQVLSIKNLYEESFETIHYIENAIKAQALFHKDRDYVIKDGEIIIVDEFTGRLMNGRRWSDGLHQAVEAKEKVTVQRESQTWATITFQNYFRLYDKLSGMTGTAATEAEEFKKIYDLEVIIIPTNKEIKRKDSQDLIFKSQRDKYAAVAAKVKELNKLGQPVLIGTTSIDKNNIISSLLQKQGVPHQVLNAKNHRSEAEIIAKAGKVGAVTVATNMAGRGVDIVLGGPKENVDPKSWQKDHDKVIELGGLYVIGTERHESRRIDNQLRGRGGRQGDPGYSQFYVALDDDLMRIFGGEKIASLMTRFNMPDNEALTHPLVSKVIEQIQVKVEGYNFDVRKSLVEYDDVINKQRQIIYKLRDNTLQNPSKEEVFKYLQNQINSIIATENINEFFEILPLPETERKKIKLENMMDLLKNEWGRREEYFGEDISKSIMIYAIISTIDPLWVEHLTALDDLRDGVRLRGYAQKDPLIEYRKEGFEMFQDLMGKFEYNLARKLYRLEPVQNPININVPKNTTEARGEIESDTSETKTPITKSTISRNNPCPCGSGKKYKKCCYPKFG
jgi:preprotein translocase subunit SecA